MHILGSGGFGVVVACKERKTGRQVAMKLAVINRQFPSQAALSINREIEMLSKLSH
jgi:serine/threonine protein kinase